MDRKGWIILILCGIGLMFTYSSMQEQNKRNQFLIDQQQSQQAAEAKSSESSGAQSGNANEGFVETDKLDNSVAEKTYTLTSKNADGEAVQYVFTNIGGGIKTSSLMKETRGLDNEVALNKYGRFPIGALADDEGDVASFVYPESAVKVTRNSISFARTDKEGINIVKKWELVSDSESSHEYRLKLNILILNKGDSTLRLKDYSLISGIAAPLFEDERPDLSKWFFYEDAGYTTGSSSPFTDGFLWGKAKEMDVHAVTNLEYAGVSNQFYTTIITPSNPGSKIWIKPQMVRLTSAEADVRAYNLGISFPDTDLMKGASATFKYDVYTGPRKQSEITKLGDHTNKTMSYGWFGFGAPWMNIALNWIHDTIGVRIYEGWSWGIAIVLLTICIRILIWPLHNKSTRTMKRMAKLQPLMKEIRAEHSDNPQKVQQETMRLYKKYKVNPMGGCLPMLLQMPIFFAVFGMLTNAVELRGQGFLWVQDLSQQEAIWTIPYINIPLNILPITMALTMVFQMRMTPATGDPMQRKIFMFLPLVFFVFCYSYASALALYWTVQNIVSILQTWMMQRLPEPELVEAEPDDPNKPRKKGLMERMAEKLEDAQKAREADTAAKTGKPVPSKKKQPTDPGQKTDKDKKRSPKTGG